MSDPIKPFAKKGHYTEFHDALLDDYMPKAEYTDWKIVCFVVRKTLGWQKEDERLSYQQIAEGTGITSSSTLSRALSRLTGDEDLPVKDRNAVLLRFKTRPTDGKFPAIRYKLNPDFIITPTSPEEGDTPTGPSSLEEQGSTSSQEEGSTSLEEDSNNQVGNTTPNNQNEVANATSGDVSNVIPLEEGKKKKKRKPRGVGQEGVTLLFDKIKAKKSQGYTIHSPTPKERGSFGEFYKQAHADGFTEEEMHAALDYMVAKAAGEVDGEPKAWCGYRTALDVILTGEWKPSPKSTSLTEDQLREIREHEEEMAEILRQVPTREGNRNG